VFEHVVWSCFIRSVSRYDQTAKSARKTLSKPCYLFSTVALNDAILRICRVLFDSLMPVFMLMSQDLSNNRDLFLL